MEPNLSRLLQANQWLFLIYTNDVNSVSFWIGSLTWSFNFFQATDCLKQNALEENTVMLHCHSWRTTRCNKNICKLARCWQRRVYGLGAPQTSRGSLLYRDQSPWVWLRIQGAHMLFSTCSIIWKNGLCPLVAGASKSPTTLQRLPSNQVSVNKSFSLQAALVIMYLEKEIASLRDHLRLHLNIKSPSPSPFLGKGLILADLPMSNLKHICVIEKESCPSLQPVWCVEFC